MGPANCARAGAGAAQQPPSSACPGFVEQAGAEADLVAEDVGEGLEVPLGPVAARGAGVRVGPSPAGGCQELLGGREPDDPAGQGVEAVRIVRDEVRALVEGLIAGVAPDGRA
ncbi:hypothetical protein OG261_39460 [Streptomyces sp. NBC_01358]